MAQAPAAPTTVITFAFIPTCSYCAIDIVPPEKPFALKNCGHSFHHKCLAENILFVSTCCPACEKAKIPEEFSLANLHPIIPLSSTQIASIRSTVKSCLYDIAKAALNKLELSKTKVDVAVLKSYTHPDDKNKS